MYISSDCLKSTVDIIATNSVTRDIIVTGYPKIYSTGGIMRKIIIVNDIAAGVFEVKTMLII